MEKFINQKAEDFAAMESFQNWYLRNDEEAISFWSAWIKSNPHRQEDIEGAIALLKGLNFSKDLPGKNQVDASWQHFEDLLGETAIDSNQEVEETSKGQILFRRQYYFRIAATVALIFISVVVLKFYLDDTSSYYETNYGETMSITLPDNSVVTLNSNSSIHFANEWQRDEDRIVWLDGEAYFSVVHMINDQKFNVMTSNGLIVEVLGTEFNVNKRNGRTRVVLKSGKVKLNIDKAEVHEEMIMQPGELVEVSDTSRTIVKRLVNPEVYTSWRCKKLVFDNTSLEEIVSLLEESYGLTVEVPNAHLLEKQISGSVPSNNTNLLMEGLSEAFNLDIVWSKNHVKIMSRQ